MVPKETVFYFDIRMTLQQCRICLPRENPREGVSESIINVIPNTDLNKYFKQLYHVLEQMSPYTQLSGTEDLHKAHASFSSTISGSVHSFPSKVCELENTGLM